MEHDPCDVGCPPSGMGGKEWGVELNQKAEIRGSSTLTNQDRMVTEKSRSRAQVRQRQGENVSNDT